MTDKDVKLEMYPESSVNADMDMNIIMKEAQKAAQDALAELDIAVTTSVSKARSYDESTAAAIMSDLYADEDDFITKVSRGISGAMEALGKNSETLQKIGLNPVTFVKQLANAENFDDTEVGKVFNVIRAGVAEKTAHQQYLKENNIPTPKTFGSNRVFGNDGMALSPEESRAQIENYMLAKEQFFKTEVGASLRAERIKAGKILFDYSKQRAFNYGMFSKIANDEELKVLLGTNDKELAELSETKLAGEIAGTAAQWYAAGQLSAAVAPFKAAEALNKMQTVLRAGVQTGAFMGAVEALDIDNNVQDVIEATGEGFGLGVALPAAGYGIQGGAKLVQKIGTDPLRKYVLNPVADKVKVKAYNTIKASNELAIKAGDKLTKGQTSKIRKARAEEAWKASEANARAHLDSYREVMKPYMDKTNPIRLKAKYYAKDGSIKAKYLDDYGNFDLTKTGLKSSNVDAVSEEWIGLIMSKNTKSIQNFTDLNTNIYNILYKNGAYKSADGLLTGTAVQNMAKNLHNDGVKQLNKLGFDNPANRKRLEGLLKGTVKPTAAEKEALKPIRAAMKLHGKVYKSITGKTSEANYYTRMAKQEIYDAVETGKMLNMTGNALKQHVDDAVGANIDKRIVDAISGLKKPEDVKSFIKAGTRMPKFLRKRNLPDSAWQTAQEADPYKVLNNMLIRQLPQMQNRNIAKGLRKSIKLMEDTGFRFDSANKLWLNQVANKYDPKYGAVAGLRKGWASWVARQPYPQEWKQVLRDMKDPLSYGMDKALTINAIGGLALKPSYIAKNMTQPYQGLMLGRPMLTTIQSQKKAVQLFGKSAVIKDMAKYTPEEKWALKTMGYMRGDSLATGAGIDKSGKFIKDVLFANVTASDRANVFTSLIANKKWALKMGMSSKKASDFAKAVTAMEQHLYQSSTRSVIGTNFATKPVAQFTGWGFDTMDFALHASNALKQRFPEYAQYMVGRHPLAEFAKYAVVQNGAIGILGEMTGYNLDSARPQNIVKSTYVDTPLSWLNTAAGLFPMGQEYSNTGNINRMLGSLDRLIPGFLTGEDD